MTIVERWTGREAKLLRAALRLSVRDFSARLGVAARTVNTWEERLADITPLPHMQEVLDTALSRASDEVKARFAAATGAAAPQPETVPAPKFPLQGAMFPLVVNGQLVLMPFDADALVVSGLGVLLDELAAPGTAQSATLAAREEVQERGITVAASPDLWQAITEIAFGSGESDLDLDRLVSSLDADEPRRQVGTADLDTIELTSGVLRRCDFAYGGGLARAAAIARLRSVLRLRKSAATPEIRVRLDIAAADLAMLAAWCSYDVEQHAQARSLWIVALKLCRQTDHPCAADLAVGALLDMAHQSLHLMRPDDALRLAGLGMAVENGFSGAVSDATRSYLASVQSWGYAALGQASACERAVGQAEQHFAAVDPETAPPWAAHVDIVELTAQQGHAWYLLSATQPSAAARAVPLLRQAVDGYGPAYQRLRMLDDCLTRHQTADVADLRHDIQTACAAS